jgi:hypothetical protein
MYVPPKLLLVFNGLHAVISQKMAFFILVIIIIIIILSDCSIYVRYVKYTNVP